MFLKLFIFIKEALLEFKCSYLLDFIDFEVLKYLQNAPDTRAKLAIEVLSRNDTTIYSASLKLECMQKKIVNSTSNI
jgi:hypothetical protein